MEPAAGEWQLCLTFTQALTVSNQDFYNSHRYYASNFDGETSPGKLMGAVFTQTLRAGQPKILASLLKVDVFARAHQGWPVKLTKLPPGPAGLGPWPGFPRKPTAPGFWSQTV